MTIENVCRINVWPTMAAARAAFDGADGSELCGRMIVWPTTALAKEYYTENSGEGGAGAPAWVPSGAKIHIDFLGGTPQGRAWVDGTGEVAIETLLGTDPNTVAAWAANGSIAVSSPLDTESDRPPDELVAAIIDGNTAVATTSITIYDPLPTTAGLSALSATT